MVELIFVIVILGIIASVALPRLAGSREDAEITRARAQIAAIRTGIQTTRGANLLAQKGSGYPQTLKVTDVTNGTKLDANWNNDGSQESNTYTLTIQGVSATFTYDPTDGSFKCSGDLCAKVDN